MIRSLRRKFILIAMVSLVGPMAVLCAAIGLSTAKAIVTRYKGRISNHYSDGVITFTAVIPQTG